MSSYLRFIPNSKGGRWDNGVIDEEPFGSQALHLLLTGQISGENDGFPLLSFCRKVMYWSSAR